MAAVAAEEEHGVQDLHGDGDDMLLGFLDAREEEVYVLVLWCCLSVRFSR